MHHPDRRHGWAVSADRWIEQLRLVPHPEGGFYRETYRHAAVHGGRGVMAAIYFLLRRGEVSRWHRIDAVEIWHHYDGAPLSLRISLAGEPPVERIVGKDVRSGEVLQAVVPAGAWQSAASMGEFTLVGCVTAPAFEFAGFELAPPHAFPPD